MRFEISQKEVSPKFQLKCILVGIFLGVSAFQLAGDRFREFDPDEVGLGLNTIAAEKSQHSTTVNPLELVPAIRSACASGDNVVLWLGASQLHAINDPEQGDDLAVGYANQRSVANQDRYIYVQFSLPNANFHELLCSYLVLRSAGVKVDTLLLALTYDDLREEGIRPDVRKWMKSPEIWTTEPQLDELNVLQEELNKLDVDHGNPSSPMANNPISGSHQEWLETKIVDGLESFWPTYRRRGQIHSAMRTFLQTFTTSSLKGAFLRHCPEVPEHMKNWNQGALETLLTVALKDGLRICLYKQPIGPASIAWGNADQEAGGSRPFLHNREKYDRWHSSIEALSRETPEIYYQDFESIVPDSLWGLTHDGDLDIFHFKDEGHRILGTAINSWLRTLP